MKKQAYPMFDASAIPADLCPIATTLNPMLPGDWRSQRPVVDRAKCVKCAVCWLYCPVQCVVEKARWFDINLATCKGCGICARECPQRAITMIEEASRPCPPCSTKPPPTTSSATATRPPPGASSSPAPT